jgi:hypothetical protein
MVPVTVAPISPAEEQSQHNCRQQQSGEDQHAEIKAHQLHQPYLKAWQT